MDEKSSDFLKDEDSGQAVYYHMLDNENAVLFCSPKCSSNWSLENKEKIWDRKTRM
jgi:hypothetical protein